MDNQLQHTFDKLTAEWKDATSYKSPVEMASHPAYQEIIKMGSKVVPLILRELERELDDWFIALAEITGANPVPEESRGRMKIMARKWLDWGRENGVI